MMAEYLREYAQRPATLLDHDLSWQLGESQAIHSRKLLEVSYRVSDTQSDIQTQEADNLIYDHRSCWLQRPNIRH